MGSFSRDAVVAQGIGIARSAQVLVSDFGGSSVASVLAIRWAATGACFLYLDGDLGIVDEL